MDRPELFRYKRKNVRLFGEEIGLGVGKVGGEAMKNGVVGMKDLFSRV